MLGKSGRYYYYYYDRHVEAISVLVVISTYGLSDLRFQSLGRFSGAANAPVFENMSILER